MNCHFEGDKSVCVFRPIQEFTKKKPGPKPLIFSERRRLAQKFKEWADENDVVTTPEGIIAYLSSAGVLNIDRAREVLNGEE